MADEPEFTVRDAVAWLGLTWEQYEAMCDATRDNHGGPQIDAILAVQHQYQRDATTPAEVLASCDPPIDPADPVAAARAYAKGREQYASEPLYGPNE